MIYLYSGATRAKQSVVKTVENRLTSLVRSLRSHLQERILKNPTPKAIQEMDKCLDLEDIVYMDKTKEIKENRETSLKNIMKKAKYTKNGQDTIIKKYETFQRIIKEMNNVESESESTEIVRRFEHLLFQTHTCENSCTKVFKKRIGINDIKVCPKSGTIFQPRKPNLMKFVHLFCKEPSLYKDVKSFLHLLLRFNFPFLILSFTPQVPSKDPCRGCSRVYGKLY